MITLKAKKVLVVAVFNTFAAISLSQNAVAQTPWLPSPGSSDLTLSLANQKADDFKPGNASAKLPATLKQTNFGLTYNYGVNDALALDATVGYAKSSFIQVPGLAPNGGLSGVTDSRLGLRYRLLDDTGADPISVTLGAAAILKGSYDTGALPAIGDGANALEVSVSVGKIFNSTFSAYGTLGYRDRKAPVPNENFIKLGANVNFTPQFFAGLNYEKVDAKDGLDIGGPGFSPARFPEVQEDYTLSSVTVGFRINKSLTAALQFGDKKGQRNTAEGKVIGFSVQSSF
jgi:hypothetical protein